MIENEAARRDSGMYERAAARIEGRSAPETPAPQPRREESSGRFEPRERPAGREAEERKFGYRPLERKRDDEESIDADNREQMRAAAERIAQSRSMETEEVKTGLKPNVSMTTDQAGEMLKEGRDADKNQAALDKTKAAQEAVDKLRGVETEPRQPQLETAEPDIEATLKHPKIAAALQERVTAAETQRQHFETSVKEVGKMRIATLVADFPELANLPLDQYVPAIKAMHQREPARAVQIIKRLQGVAEVEAALGQMKAQKEATAKAEFANYSTRETQRFQQMTKGIDPQRMAAIKAEIPNMLKAAGVTDPRSFLTAIQGQTVFPRASAEMIMMKAAMYDMAMNAAKPTPTRPVPHVTRPGVAAPRTNPQSATLKALNQRFNVTGDIKDATKLLQAKRKATKR